MPTSDIMTNTIGFVSYSAFFGANFTLFIVILGINDKECDFFMFGINNNEDRSGEALLQPRPKIGDEEVSKAIATLQRYKSGKTNLEQRVTEDEQWYKMRHFDVIRKRKNPKGPNPASAWLFNTIMNKHADASDNYPEPIVLPREASDQESAKILSSILPVVMERNGFEDVYSENWGEKLKHGTAVYGVFWDAEAENGLGDIAIKPISLLNVFWEPGIEDIQKSKYLFIVDLVDKETLEQMYPEHIGNLAGNTIDVKQYVYDDDVDTSDKVVVVDCYYRVRQPSGRTVLHLMKFCGNVLLFASENEEAYAEGFYAHGKYPLVFDTLFPDKGTPCGFGYVSVCKDPQLYIDALGANILESSLMATKPRYMVLNSSGINIDQFKNWNEQIVEVEGLSLDEAHIRRIEVPQLGGIYANVYDMKIQEMKETSGNRDVNSGGAGGGITSGAAIATLQESGNKGSRDMISRSYTKYSQIVSLCIELMRQFYDEKRTFRIIGANGADYDFVDFSNEGIRDQEMPPSYEGAETSPDYVPMFRRPIFDIKVKAQKRNPYSQLSMNETAKELYRLGAFNPEKAQEALIMLEMMEFEGIDAVRDKVREGETLLNMLRQMSVQMEQMSALLGIGGGMPTGAPSSGGSAPAPAPSSGGGRTIAGNIVSSQKRGIGSYGEKLVKNARPSME